jgi:Fe2+ or Zn2+ uptake regulation protein
MNMKITVTQANVLAFLATQPDRRFDGDEIARQLYDSFRPSQGAHRTAASLVRRGMVSKAHTVNGLVCYQINPSGLAALHRHGSL